ncbi:hypothetical protein [Saccharothrix sp. HUAS TT1]|uniref:hypothetical protein n=1 Tax=unclassified Saccharothrix TaxID=2593673 RepID=UPI00345C470B
MDGEDPGGGSVVLARLLDRHGEAILADFRQYYGVNLVEAYRDWSPLYLLAHIRQLPIESRTVAAMRGGEQFNGWGVDRYFLAALIDAVHDQTYAFVAANSKRKPKRPKPIERPKKAHASQSKTNPWLARTQAIRRARGG